MKRFLLVIFLLSGCDNKTFTVNEVKEKEDLINKNRVNIEYNIRINVANYLIQKDIPHASYNLLNRFILTKECTQGSGWENIRLFNNDRIDRLVCSTTSIVQGCLTEKEFYNNYIHMNIKKCNYGLSNQINKIGVKEK